MRNLWRGTRAPLDAPYVAHLPEAIPPLMFIMGCHRSGTSMLHHLLASSGAFNYITAYDIVKYDELLYNRAHRREDAVKAALQAYLSTLKTRGLDNLPVGVHYPEEYRFILSTFRLSFSLGARRKIQEFFAPHLTPETYGKFLEMCRKKRALAAQPQTLLLKNPNDFYSHFLHIHSCFPTARMLFMHRHPLHILNSYVHSFGNILQEKSAYWALLDPGYHRLFGAASLKRCMALRAIQARWNLDLLARRLAESLQYYLDKSRLLLAGQALAMRYEDFCQDPHACLSRLESFLHVAMPHSLADTFVQPRNLPLLPRVRATYTRHLGRFQAYLSTLDYPPYPEGDSPRLARDCEPDVTKI
jgi:hypothetical protein